jgi:FkbM family methyltransferase
MIRKFVDWLRRLRHRSTSIDEVETVYKALDKVSWGPSPGPSVMIDVGAHYGSSLRRFLEEGWGVYAFEPDHESRQKLLNRLGKSERLTVDPRAVSDEIESSVTFYKSGESTGISGLSPFHPSHTESGTVETITLSRYIQETNIDRVDFLKVDTEGHDLAVLKGFPWSTHHPQFVVCEFEDSKTTNYGYRLEDLAEYLSGQGYSVFVSEWHPIESYGGSHRWNTYHRYPCTLQNPDAWGNLIGARTTEAAEAINGLLRSFAAKNLATRVLNLL